MDLTSLIRTCPALDLVSFNILLDPIIPLFCWRFRLVSRKNVSSSCHFCLKQKKKKKNSRRIGKRLYGSGRTEEPVRMLETSSEEWEVVRKLPASFFYILAGVNFWINGGSKNRGFDRIPRNFIFSGVGCVPPQKIFFFFPDLVGILADVGRKALSAVFLLMCF